MRDCSQSIGLYTANCGRWKSWNPYQAQGPPNEEHASVKNSSVHVLICQEFEQFAIAKRECLILALCPWYSLASRLDPSEVGEGVACLQTISPPSGKNREERLPISSYLLFSSLLFARFFPEGWETSVHRHRKEADGVKGSSQILAIYGQEFFVVCNFSFLKIVDILFIV